MARSESIGARRSKAERMESMGSSGDAVLTRDPPLRTRGQGTKRGPQANAWLRFPCGQAKTQTVQARKGIPGVDVRHTHLLVSVVVALDEACLLDGGADAALARGAVEYGGLAGAATSRGGVALSVRERIHPKFLLPVCNRNTFCPVSVHGQALVVVCLSMQCGSSVTRGASTRRREKEYSETERQRGKDGSYSP